MAIYITALLSLLLFSDLVAAQSLFQGAPCWVTNTSCVTAKYAAVGLSKVTYSEHPQLANTQAHHDAMSNLALVIKAQVSMRSSSRKIVKRRAASTNWQRTGVEQASVLSIVELTGVKSRGKWLDENGTLYVLVVVDGYNDINNNKVLEHNNPATSSAGVYDGIIKSNIDYAMQLTKSIRTDITSLTR